MTSPVKVLFLFLFLLLYLSLVRARPLSRSRSLSRYLSLSRARALSLSLIICLHFCQLFSCTVRHHVHTVTRQRAGRREKGEMGEFIRKSLPPSLIGALMYVCAVSVSRHASIRAFAKRPTTVSKETYCMPACVRSRANARTQTAGGAVLGCVSRNMGPISHVCHGGGATPQYPLYATAHYSQTHVRLFFPSPGSEGQQGARVFLTTQS